MDKDSIKVYHVYNHDLCGKKGGAVRYLRYLTDYLPLRGIRVVLLGFKNVECPGQKTTNIKLAPVHYGPNIWWKYLLGLFLRLPKLDIPKDAVIHVHRFEYALPFLIFKRKNPLVLTLHGRLATARIIFPRTYWLVERVYWLLEKLVFKRADAILTVADDVKESFEKVHGKDISIHVIPLGIDIDKFKPLDKKALRKKYNLPEDSKVLLFVGVFDVRKNLPMLLQSFKYVLKKYPNSILLLAGDGPEKELLLKLSRELSIASSVRFLGEIPNEKLPEIYNLADVFVITSRNESGPYVVKEALSCGIPVVSTKVGIVPKYVNSKYAGKVIDSYNARAFAEAVIETLSIVERYPEKVRETCRRIAIEHFDFNKMLDEYIRIYLQVLKAKEVSPTNERTIL